MSRDATVTSEIEIWEKVPAAARRKSTSSAYEKGANGKSVCRC
jgi:hypothetical protein